MDPYLESPDIWPDLHDRLMNIYAEQLSPLLAPKYTAELHPQIIIERIEDDSALSMEAEPDIAIIKPNPFRLSTLTMNIVEDDVPLLLREPTSIRTRVVTIEIRRRSDEQLVTAIELLSPVNKRPGPKRQAYLKKRRAYLASHVHLVEIDLLRKYPRMPLEEKSPRCDYIIMLHNAYDRQFCRVWLRSVRQPLPTLPIPLRRPDPDVPLHLQQAFHTAYDRARYDLRVDYRKPPVPPLAASGDAAWATSLIPPA